MKILVISLLRLGDIVMAAPVIEGLKSQNSSASVDLLINGQFASVTNIIKSVDRVFEIDRENIQQALGERDRSMFEAFDRLWELISELRSQKYDQVINLTHNRFSGWIADLIEAKEIEGLHIDDRGQASFGNAWFRYMNTHMAENGGEPFHFIDIFRFGSGITKLPGDMGLMETPWGQTESARLLEGIDRLVLIQPLTSDPKKNWPFQSYERAVECTNQMVPGLTFGFLCSPSEKQRVDLLVRSLSNKGIRALSFCCDLEVAFSLIKRSELLLTGDTSIKHMAAAAGIKVVELSLGSSNFKKTGAYVRNAIILQPREACAPCDHRSECHRESHVCAERIEPEVVSAVLQKSLLGHYNELRLVAKEYQDVLDILRVDFCESGFWTYHSLSPRQVETSIARLLELTSWKILISQEWLEPIGQYGTESLNVRRALKSAFPEVSAEDWRDQVETLENEVERLESKLGAFALDLRAYAKRYSEKELLTKFQHKIVEYMERSDAPLTMSYRAEILQALEDLATCQVSEFVRLRKLSEIIKRAQSRVDVELRLIRSIRSNTMEMI